MTETKPEYLARIPSPRTGHETTPGRDLPVRSVRVDGYRRIL